MSSDLKNPDETQETIISNTTTEEEQKPNNNFLKPDFHSLFTCNCSFPKIFNSGFQPSNTKNFLTEISQTVNTHSNMLGVLFYLIKNEPQN